MNLPTRNRTWVKEIKLAFSKAEKEIMREGIDLIDIYTLAPKYMVKNRNIKSTATLLALQEQTISEYSRELELEPEARNSYLFHFVLHYVHCHEYADIISEKECDKIMELIMEKIDLWPEEDRDFF